MRTVGRLKNGKIAQASKQAEAPKKQPRKTAKQPKAEAPEAEAPEASEPAEDEAEDE